MKKTIRILICAMCLLLVVVLACACDDTPVDPQETTGATSSCEAGHTYEVTQVIKQATCTEAGKQKVKCSVCGNEAEQDVAATGVHTPKNDWEVVLAATCGQDGKQIKKCSHCDLQVEEQVIPATGAHTASDWKTVAELTCGQDERKIKECTVCHAVLDEQTRPATGDHTKGTEWQTVLAATPTAQGRKAIVCITCGHEMETKPISALGTEATVNSASNSSALNLTAHTVILPSSTKTNLLPSVANKLASAIGANIAVNSDLTGAVAKEILIGDTNRAESTAAKALINGEGFAITVSGNKIAIVGTNEAQTIYAVNYFINNYLTGSASSVSVPTSVVGATSNTTVVSGKGFDATIILSEKLYFVSEKQCDYGYVAADKIASVLSKQSKLGVARFTIKKDSESLISGKEIIIGQVDRAEYAAFLSTLDANEYGILVKDGKIVLAAWNNKAMEVCVSEFEKLMKAIPLDTDGTRVWNLPDGFYASAVANESWIVDFPRPDDGKLASSIDANDNSLQFVYQGLGVNAEAFEAYCQKLVSAGYKMVTTNTIENSIFRLYINETKGVVLNVSYNDYKYADKYYSEEKKAAEGNTYVEYFKSIKVTSSPIDSITTPSGDIINPDQTYNKVADSTITAVGLRAASVGMCYIIRLEDGSFIIYDGGALSADDDPKVKIWDTLNKLYIEAYGTEPTSEKPIRIAAWIITHSHTDHFGSFKDFLTEYGKSPLVRMDYLIGTFPATNTLYSTGSRNEDIAILGKQGEIAKLQALVTNGGEGTFKFIEAFSGQKLYFANVEIEVLMTYEDHPGSFYHSNETSTITRLSINSTRAAKGDTVSGRAEGNKVLALFLADANPGQSRYMCAMYGDYLKSDIVQLAHHGNRGCEKELYVAVSPTTVLWPHASRTVVDMRNPDSVNKEPYSTSEDLVFGIKVDVFVCNLECVRYIFSSDDRYSTTFTLTADGPVYSLYDVLTGKNLAFNKSFAVDKESPLSK